MVEQGRRGSAAVVKRETEVVAQLSVPLASDTGWGRNWYEAKA